MDSSVDVTALPPGITYVSVDPFGTSAWTVTGRVVAMNAEGVEVLFFLKVGATWQQQIDAPHLTACVHRSHTASMAE